METPVQEVLQDAELGSGFEGILADDLEVKPEYEEAVAAVLGERLQALRFAPGADVAAVLAKLRSHPGRHLCQLEIYAREPRWDTGVALTQVLGMSATLQGMADGVYLVEDVVPYMSQTLPPGVVLVTAAGEILTWQGKVVLGQKNGSSTALLQHRRRIAELEHSSNGLRKQVKEQEANLEYVRNLYAKAEAAHAEQQYECERLHMCKKEAQHNLYRLKQQAESLEREQLRHEKQQQQSTQRLDSLQRDELTLLEQQELTLTQEIDAIQKQVAETEQKWEEARADMQGQQQRTAEQSSANAVASEQFRSLCNDIKHVERDITRQEKRQELLRQRQKELDTEVVALERQERELCTRTEVLLQKLRASKKSVTQAHQDMDRRNESLQHAEQNEREQRTALFRERQKLDSTTLELEHNAEDVARQQQWLEQTYAVKLEEQTTRQKPLPDDAQARIKRLQRRIDDFGEVNLLAVEEYDALSARHTFLLEQQEDLLQSIDDLRKAIAQINRKSRSRFKKTFSQINEQFMYVFPRLFSGGNAKLVLTDPEDMLATGIDIEARPPGKKLQNVNLLSGGEKALTAVALIFAIFQIKPSPFCILDEVDAPLDHANIGRFNAVVREMATTSQFVIITHNTRTMEIADTLYGVTMEEPGVSRLVSVDMSTYAATDKRD
ncbi:MAG: hypothetical protein LC645_01155 [Geobacteraceae bacterium]|nr:hypothetical protein [Geobacteraceae bacterium]